ncbi:MAG: spore photoproduct lyase [Desulforhopalus sp.]|jgi:spore photoproduct lyase
MKQNKLPSIPLFEKLENEQQKWLISLAETWPLSFQQLRMIVEYCADMVCWNVGSPEQFYNPAAAEQVHGKKAAAIIFQQIKVGYDTVKNSEKKYASNTPVTTGERKFPAEQIVESPLNGNIMGICPVASEKTRCCNLKTLDAVQQCGFDCSYCSIQSFYHNNQVRFIKDIDSHLESLDLNPDEIYHIGTGQSSDSLMWGNRFGLHESLSSFAEKHPNVILEMKSKSGRIEYFLEHQPPHNIVFTWSLNPPIVIEHEEKGAAGLDKRLESARLLADKNIPVGFHFHPMVWYEGWQNDYISLVSKVTEMFESEEVVMISLGTLTFIKPVIKRIRQRFLNSSILQMPMEESSGKLSYPLEVKKELFSTVYNAFPKRWQEEVFFYMCMEDESLWQPVFGRSYSTNEIFEADMLDSYMKKIKSIQMNANQSPR